MNAASTGRTIAFVMYPEPSALNASYVLARRLRDAGHRVVYVCTQPFEKRLLDRGLECRVVDWFGEPAIEEEHDRIRGLGAGKGARLKWRLRVKAYQESLENIEGWLAAERPDLALIDPLITEYATSFVKARIPILAANTNLAFVYNSSVPPVFSGIVPRSPVRALDRAKNILAWSKEYAKYVAYDRLWIPAQTRFNLSRTEYRAYNRHRHLRECGPRLRFGEYWYRLDVPELVFSPPEIDFPVVAEGSPRCYAGTCVDTERDDGSLDWSRLDAEKPLVYCSLGTYSKKFRHARPLFHAAIDALQQRPEWQLLVQVGRAADPEEFAPLPANVHLAREVPQLEVLSRASLLITHGGFGSVREAVYYGVPLIVFPCRLDQPGNAARVAFHHLGIEGRVAKVSPDALGRMIDRIMSDPSFRASVKRMQQAFREQENCQAGLDFVQSFLPGYCDP